MRKELPQQLLRELLKNSKRSDRELAKILGVSQPTITRARTRLVNEGVIKEFTVVPDFVKMGYELLAIISFKSKLSGRIQEKAVKETMSRPNIIFAGNVSGGGKNGVVLSLHRSYSDYSNFLTELRREGGEDIGEGNTMLVTLEGFIPKPLSLSYLAEEM
ncbi:MAG: Lrp/AsnC family transcriptional regulator [Candidatus Bathyarchaeota archaeon]|nr:MAG: Lrp/AsnC family transcriptional regulator [Candidatus Bathyarchaeota archaeon]